MRGWQLHLTFRSLLNWNIVSTSQSIWGKSAWDGWDANARLSATRGEQMPQVVVGDAFHAGQLCGTVNLFLAFLAFDA